MTHFWISVIGRPNSGFCRINIVSSKLQTLFICNYTYFLGYNALQSIESKQTLQRNILSPCSTACHLISLWFLSWLMLLPWRWMWYVPAKCQLIFNGLQGIISTRQNSWNSTICIPCRVLTLCLVAACVWIIIYGGWSR